MAPNGGKVRDRETRFQHARRVRYPSCPSHAAYFDILLYRETFAARAVRDGVRVGDFKTAFLQVFAVV